MAQTITRTGDEGQNYIETRQGDTPCRVNISTTAKGLAQLDITLAYATPNDMRVHVADELAVIIEQVKRALDDAGIPLAGMEGK